MSIIRADSIKDRAGDGAPDFPNGITITGVVTATTLNSVSNNIDVDDFISVGNNIQLGNAGVITATSGNFTGNVSIGGTLTYEDVTNIDSVGLITARNGISVTSGGITVLGGTITGTATTATTITVASDTTDTLCFPIFTNTGVGNNGPKVNTSKLSFNSSTGALSATSFVGNGSQLTGITQTTINNNANNRVITGSGSANTLEGESSFTYDGNGMVNIIGTGAAGVTIRSPDTTDTGVYFSDGAANAGAVIYLHTDNSMRFRVNNTNKVIIDQNGHLRPASTNTYDLGTSSDRWRNLFTQDLQLSNESSGGNDVDGTWGDYTIQEGKSDLFLINNRNGKKYKFMLKEVS